jgi:hypothetical protein
MSTVTPNTPPYAFMAFPGTILLSLIFLNYFPHRLNTYTVKYQIITATASR